jgi:AraC-like DNA-binding protein
VLHGFQLVLIAAGRGTFESHAAGPRSVDAGDVMLLFPSQWHRYKPDPATGWLEKWVELDGPTVGRLLGIGIFDPARPIVPPRDLRDFERQMDRLLRLVLGSGPRSRAEAGAIGHLLLALLHAQGETGQPASNAASMVAAAESLICSQIENSPPMPQVAKRLGVGYSRFRREFKIHTGLSPKRYLQRMRLERARRLLGSTGDALEKISERVGLCSAFHLSAAFKREFGVSPREWRLKHAAGVRPRIQASPVSTPE